MARTNIDLDEKLMAEAIRLTNSKTKKAVVNFALKELVTRKRRKDILKFEGQVKWEGKLNEMRKSRI